MTAKPPDYTTMSGAEFQRAVGADPEKWAEAVLQDWQTNPRAQVATIRDWLCDWLRDFGNATVKAQGQLLNWDKPDEHDPAR